MNDKVISIHQPNFFPWLGFFDKIYKAKEFIFFDSVQISSGKSFSSRVRILLNEKPYWLTIPVEKSGKSGQKIFEVNLLNNQEFAWKKILGTIRQSYRKAEYFQEVFALIEKYSKINYNKLSDLNIDIIKEISSGIGIKNVVFRRTSENIQLLNSLNNQTALIIECCRYYNATHYISGNGCLDFINPEMFKMAGIEFSFQNFVHPIYKQFNSKEFIPGLSIIDALMNCGFSGTEEIIKNWNNA